MMYLVSGRIVDQIGVRKAFLIAVGGWSAVGMLHGIVHNLWQLLGMRFLLGVFESANYPAGVRAIAEWFPIEERALAVGLFASGAALLAAIAAPAVSLVTYHWGWRAAFSLTGLLGFFWACGMGGSLPKVRRAALFRAGSARNVRPAGASSRRS
jgi:ACS family hexuronate transporter-like MFS transporter